MSDLSSGWGRIYAVLPIVFFFRPIGLAGQASYTEVVRGLDTGSGAQEVVRTAETESVGGLPRQADWEKEEKEDQ